MKNYQIVITSNKDKNVSELHFFATALSKEFLMDMLCPLTKFQLSIKEVDKCPKIVLSMEGLLNLIKDIKLKTKIAKNVMEVTEGVLGVFYEKPILDLHVWTGDSGEVRTYVNNMNWANINVMFPKQFKFDIKSKRPYFSGEIYLDPIDSRLWKLHYVIRTHKVIYEEVTLES